MKKYIDKSDRIELAVLFWDWQFWRVLSKLHWWPIKIINLILGFCYLAYQNFNFDAVMVKSSEFEGVIIKSLWPNDAII